MAAITFDIRGVDELVTMASTIGQNVPAKVEEITTAVAGDMQAAGDPLTPVRTGFLLSRNQPLIETNGFVGEATYYNDAPYALFVCLGHHTRSGSWVAARDWMTPALMVGGQSLQRRTQEMVLL